MKNDYIYIKLYNDKDMSLNVKLKDKCNQLGIFIMSAT